MKALGALFILAALNLSCAGESRRKDPKERLLMAKFQVEHLYHCTSCAVHMAKVLSVAPGVYRASPVVKDDAALVFYEVGKTDIEELLAELHRHAFNAKLVLGPVARAGDGRPERFLDYEIPKPKPTLKEIWAERERGRTNANRSVANAPPAAAKKVVAPTKARAPARAQLLSKKSAAPVPLPQLLIEEKAPMDLAPRDLNLEAPAQEELPQLRN